MIKLNDSINISSILVSTALGESGNGLFPYTLLPKYRKLCKIIKGRSITVIGKSATRNKRIGNFQLYKPWKWKYIQRLEDTGILNAYGLTNSGVEKCAEKNNHSRSLEFDVIPSFYPEFIHGLEVAIKETLEAIEIYDSLGFKVVELNISCPNSKEKIDENMKQSIDCIRAIKKRFRQYLIIKTSILHPLEFYSQLEKEKVAAIHALNTIPFSIIYPEIISPLHKVGGGGVSGGPAFKEAYHQNNLIRKQTRLPLIMGCGVTSQEDVKKYFDIGADSV
ncbi:MAG: hypothetical protein V1692_02515, partial [bacterium]